MDTRTGEIGSLASFEAKTEVMELSDQLAEKLKKLTLSERLSWLQEFKLRNEIASLEKMVPQSRDYKPE